MRGELVDGRYLLETRVGAGGMAEVWSARDLELDRRVALKLFGVGADKLRFAREARAAASLSHPHICQVYAYGETDERIYIVLEYLPGGTLEDRLEIGQPLADADARTIATELASALAHAHERGVLHRDVKPANVLFDEEGRAKLADFGIARVTDASTLTEAGTVLGSAAYLSPEQASGRPLTPATDVYAFGVVLYRLLTGRLPFDADDPLALAAMHVTDDAPPIASLRPDVPGDLERVAAAALAKRPEDRPADGRALLAALSPGPPAPAVPPSVARSESATQPLAPRRRLQRRHVGAGIALAALAAAGAGLALLAASEPSDAPVTRPSRRSAPQATAAPPAAPPPAPPVRRQRTNTETGAGRTSTSRAATTAPVTPPPPGPTTDTTTVPTSTEADTTAETATTAPPPTTATTAPTTTAATTTAP